MHFCVQCSHVNHCRNIFLSSSLWDAQTWIAVRELKKKIYISIQIRSSNKMSHLHRSAIDIRKRKVCTLNTAVCLDVFAISQPHFMITVARVVYISSLTNLYQKLCVPQVSLDVKKEYKIIYKRSYESLVLDECRVCHSRFSLHCSSFTVVVAIVSF